jgi:hypothetical protein
MKKIILILTIIATLPYIETTTANQGNWTARIIKIEPWYTDNVEVTIETTSDLKWAQNAILTVNCYGNNKVTQGKRDVAYKLYKGKNITTVTIPTNISNCQRAEANIQEKPK